MGSIVQQQPAREWKYPSGGPEEERKCHVCLTPEVKHPYSGTDLQKMLGPWVKGRDIDTELSGYFSLRCPVGIQGGMSSPAVLRLEDDVK